MLSFLNKKIGKTVEDITSQVMKGVVRRSPVQTGSFRDSWRQSESIINPSTTEREGQAPAARPIIKLITNKERPKKVFVSNSVSHAYKVEVEGTHTSPPGAVMHASVISVFTTD